MNTKTTYDLIVIGSGPGGYTGAIRASQLGLKTAVVEKHKTLGGVCLNVGCIPSKALLDSSEHYHFAKTEMALHGVKASSVALDLKTMLNRKNKIVQDLTGGIQYLFKKNKIDRYEGVGAFVSPHQIKVQAKSGPAKVLEGKNIMLATGSVPKALPNLSFDDDKIVSSTTALSFNKVPKKLLVVGGGYIGLEMASIWSRLGAEVVVLEYAPRICPHMDQELSLALLKTLRKQNIQILLESAIQKAEKKGSQVLLFYKDKAGQDHSLKGDYVLLAVGRTPYTEGLHLEKAQIHTNQQGFVPVNQQWRTRQSHIFAIGDLIGGTMLAHKAEDEGVAVAEILAGQAGHVNYATLPSVIYTWPESGSVGQTEEQLKKAGTAYKAGRFPFTANGRARALGCVEGFVKILAEAKTDLILGVHITGPRASDMLAEAVVAMEMGASSEDLARSFHAHPTLSEAMREAALNVDKRARQI